eukprot:2675651-Amphidinium_carterae.1
MPSSREADIGNVHLQGRHPAKVLQSIYGSPVWRCVRQCYWHCPLGTLLESNLCPHAHKLFLHLTPLSLPLTERHCHVCCQLNSRKVSQTRLLPLLNCKKDIVEA